MKNRFYLKISITIALVLTVCAIVPTKASKAYTVKRSLTLVEGETFKITPPAEDATFKTASSSKKKFVIVKKTANMLTLTAKKKGKSVIAVKLSNKTTYKYTINVKKKNITWTAFTPHNTVNENTGLNDSSVMFEIINKTGIYASAIKVDFVAYGVSGKKLFTGSKEVAEFLPNTRIHVMAGALNLQEKIKTGKITKITLLNREKTFSYKYHNKSTSITVTEMSKDSSGISLSLKNSLNEPIQGIADVVFYADAAGKKPIGFNTIDLYTIAKGSNTLSIAATQGYQSYKIFKRAYVTRY